MATEWQNPPDADIILRVPRGKDFHAHKLILSLASPVFRDLFSVPQPGPSELPIVEVHDPPEALGIFLQFIYPTRNPRITNTDILMSVLRLADKYDARDVIDIYVDHPPSTSDKFSPIQTYAILCACGRENEAGAVARIVPFSSLKTLDSSPLLQLITAAQYQRLVSLLTVRNLKTRELVGYWHGFIANDGTRWSCNDAAHSIYSSTIVTMVQSAFEADPCVQVDAALFGVLSAPCTAYRCGDSCRYTMSGLRGYVEKLLRALGQMVQNLQW